MAFVLKTAKTLRNNWKKSTVAAVVIYYGYTWTEEYFQTKNLMRVYCEKAAKYGQQTIPINVDPRKITVILNPSANRRKASDEFEKYCAPILHLAGICVNVIKTESEGHAKTLIDDISETDAVIVAGGDGTFSEVLTGILRRTQENTKGLVPIGVLPLGRTNSTSNKLFPGGQNKLEKVKALADATMAVVEDVVKTIDVLKIEVLDNEVNKPIYAASGIKWGAYRDAETKKDSYWVYGNLRKYATYLFNGYKSSLMWKCDAELIYSPPCNGCSNCKKEVVGQKKWYTRFVKDQQPKYSHIINPICQMKSHQKISTVDLTVTPQNTHDDNPKLLINLGPKSVGYFNFVRQGWKSENGQEREIKDVIVARTLVIKPKVNLKSEKEAWLSIDNEAFELKPIRVTLLPKLINVFCKKDNL